MTNENAFPVNVHDAGERLDRFVARAAGVSLRTARRLVRRAAVTVDGSVRTEGYKLKPGQAVLVAQEAPGAPQAVARLLLAGSDYAAFYKPPGLHTAAICGSFEPSLEGVVADIAPGMAVTLVNRLDRDTSGIVLGALSQRAALRFRELEDAGLVDKRYLALVQGTVSGPLLLRWELDTADRAVVRISGAPSADRLRWTLARPVCEMKGLTLIEARIEKGARHQIRAHLSHAGHPIAGDMLYGGPQAVSLRLHHWCVSLPEFSAQAGPDWEEVQAQVSLFMEENTCGSPWPSRH